MKNCKYILCYFIVFLFGCTSLLAQTTTSKIKDNSVSNSSSTGSANAVLELESTSKGFLIPRMSSAQRDAISMIDRIAGDGLTIYNIDTDCINYWSKAGNMWMSLCGTLPACTCNNKFCSM